MDLMKTLNVEEICEKTIGMKYLGPFKSPDDLNLIYQQVDLIALFYPDKTTAKHFFLIKSVCNANRFYEACYFRKPLISFSFCEDGKRVKEYSIGLALDTYHIDSNIEIINKEINKENLLIWNRNLMNLEEDIYYFGKEKEIIKNKITEILL
jgi:hypothetical protein